MGEMKMRVKLNFVFPLQISIYFLILNKIATIGHEIEKSSILFPTFNIVLSHSEKHLKKWMKNNCPKFKKNILKKASNK